MAEPIDFYFDFSSPYGYFGASKIDELAASFDRDVRWHPILLGAIFKQTGAKPIMEYDIKADYAKRDMDRLSRFMDIPFRLPNTFPVATIAACRGFHWLDMDTPDIAKAFAMAVYKAYFVDGLDISDPAIIIDIAAALDVDRTAFSQGISDAVIKERLRDDIDRAIRKGVFGSPYFIIDGEPFWGADRFWMMKRWMKSGGW